jgi:MYXO-CTERM domain-containing protein
MKQLAGTAVLLAGLAALPSLAQTTADPNRAAADPTTSRVDDRDGFNYGWLGLLGLAGLLGMRRRAANDDLARDTRHSART